jgi:hypothetical protein
MKRLKGTVDIVRSTFCSDTGIPKPFFMASKAFEISECGGGSPAEISAAKDIR